MDQQNNDEREGHNKISQKKKNQKKNETKIKKNSFSFY